MSWCIPGLAGARTGLAEIAPSCLKYNPALALPPVAWPLLWAIPCLNKMKQKTKTSTKNLLVSEAGLMRWLFWWASLVLLPSGSCATTTWIHHKSPGAPQQKKKNVLLAPRVSPVLGAVLLNPHSWRWVCLALFTAKLSTAATCARSLSWKATFQPAVSKALSTKVISGLGDAVITARGLLLCDIFPICTLLSLQSKVVYHLCY